MERQAFSDSSESSTMTYIDYPRQPAFENMNAHTNSSYNSKQNPLKTVLPTLYPPGDLCDLFFLCRRPYRTRRVGLNDKIFGVIWLVRDTCGIICLIITWMLILYAEFVISAIILLRTPCYWLCLVNGFIYHFLAFMAVVSHFKAFSTDPGAIPLGVPDDDILDYVKDNYGYSSGQMPKCAKCVSLKPPRVHHCRICSRCIRKMDHHCPWINNCVGEANQKFFVLFTFYICLMSMFAIYMCAHFFVQCMESDWETCRVHNSSAFTSLLDFSPLACGAFLLGLIMESFVFGLFTLVMCISQLCSIAADETKVESLQKSTSPGRETSKLESLTAVCGSPLSINWLNPFTSSPQGRQWTKSCNTSSYRPLVDMDCESGSGFSRRAGDGGYPGDQPSVTTSRNTVHL